MYKTEEELRKEELLGIWTVYVMSGQVPENVSLEDLQDMGNLDVKVKDVTSLINGALFKERKLIEQLIDDNGVKDIILRDKLGVTDKDFENAKAVRAQELADFVAELEAELATAKAEMAMEADKNAKGE